jgi:hypothetical protein
MNPEMGTKPRHRWPWALPPAAFLIGLSFGWRTIHSKSEPLLIPTSIAVSRIDHLALDQPLPGNGRPRPSTSALRCSLFPTKEMEGAPLAEAVELPSFDLQTPWLKQLLAEKLPRNPTNAFAGKMLGLIEFSSNQTKLHICSDNGFRIRIRNSVGEERLIDNWVDDITDDFELQVSAEPGRYEIEIDYFNSDGDAYFCLWADPATIQFLPIPQTALTPAR